jgi:group I intron endonuclease
MRYIIYKCQNKITNKVYIGQTKQTLERRMKEHQWNALKRNKRHIFYDALKSYGFSNFSWEVLLYCEKEQADYYEIELISKHKSTSREFGYNSDGGGNPGKYRQCGLKGTANPMYGKPLNETSKQAFDKYRNSDERKLKSSTQFKSLWNDPNYKNKLIEKKKKLVKIRNIVTGQEDQDCISYLSKKYKLSNSGLIYYRKSKDWIIIE